MSRTLRISLAIGGAIVVLAAIVPLLISVDQFRPTIEAKASAALGRKVDLGKLSLSPWNVSLSAESLAVADDPAFSHGPFLTAKSVDVGVRLWPLIVSQSLSVTGITVQNPEVTLIRNLAGRWNYSSIASGSGAGGAFSINTLELNDGRLIVTSMTSQRHSDYDHVKVRASHVSLTSECPVIASATMPGGGTFTFAGTVGPVNQADVSLTPLTAAVALERLNLASTGFLDSSAGLGGLVDMKATIASRSGQAAVAGSATVSKALFVAGGSPASQPVVVAFDSKYNLHNHSGVLSPSTLKIGAAAGRLEGTYNVGGEHPILNLRVVGDRMPASDLESFVPALGIHLPRGANLSSGTIAANLAVVGATNRLVSTGTLGLSNATVSGFDLGAKTGAISALTGLKTGKDLNIERLTTDVRIAPDGLRFDQIDAVVRSVGHLTGAGTVDAANRLDFKMVAMLTSPLGGAVGTAVGTAGALDNALGKLAGREAVTSTKGERISFRVKGTTSDPEFVPDVGGAALQTLEQVGAPLKQEVGIPNTNSLGAVGGLFKGKKP